MSNKKKVIAEFLQERMTKRMVRFYEVEQPGQEKLTGTIYLSQSALKEIGYKEGDTIVITVERK